MPAKFELIAPCFFGCESTAKFELTRIGAENIRVEDGRLSFCGGAEMIAAANLNLRTVERVMLLLARYKATTFDELFDGVYSIPWEEFLPADAAFPVTGSSLNSQLTSIPACQSVIKKAVVKRLMKGHRTTVLPESGVEYKVRFMLRKNVCEIMLDTTGEAVEKTLAMDGPVICEIFVDMKQGFEPKAAAKMLPDGTMVSVPLEDLAPFLPEEELKENMIIPLVENK